MPLGIGEARNCRPRGAGGRLQNVSKTGGESRVIGWTAVSETERRNRLCFKRLEPEVARHHHVRKQACSEFESLPPSHENLPCVFNDLQHRVISLSNSGPQRATF
jgi:hypothetical protein